MIFFKINIFICKWLIDLKITPFCQFSGQQWTLAMTNMRKQKDKTSLDWLHIIIKVGNYNIKWRSGSFCNCIWSVPFFILQQCFGSFGFIIICLYTFLPATHFVVWSLNFGFCNIFFCPCSFDFWPARGPPHISLQGPLETATSSSPSLESEEGKGLMMDDLFLCLESWHESVWPELQFTVE